MKYLKLYEDYDEGGQNTISEVVSEVKKHF
jgi:hypothetical protein